MITNNVERRPDANRNTRNEKLDAEVIQQGVVIQRKGDTVSAFEYMRNRGIASATIQRVLTGGRLRNDDALVLGPGAQGS